jgi:hypothetical protein
VREHRREGGRAGGVIETFRCLGFARYERHEGERHEGERPMGDPMAAGEGDPGGVWLPVMALAV